MTDKNDTKNKNNQNHIFQAKILLPSNGGKGKRLIKANKPLK